MNIKLIDALYYKLLDIPGFEEFSMDKQEDILMDMVNEIKKFTVPKKEDKE